MARIRCWRAAPSVAPSRLRAGSCIFSVMAAKGLVGGTEVQVERLPGTPAQIAALAVELAGGVKDDARRIVVTDDLEQAADQLSALADVEGVLQPGSQGKVLLVAPDTDLLRQRAVGTELAPGMAEIVREHRGRRGVVDGTDRLLLDLGEVLHHFDPDLEADLSPHLDHHLGAGHLVV